MKRLKIISSLLVIVALLLAFTPARAGVTPDDILGFTGICNNNAGDVAIGEAQITVDVTDNGDGRVRFTFYNAGPAASNISEIYFDDGSLLDTENPEIANNPPDVDFILGAQPGDLPCGEELIPAFDSMVMFNTEADDPAPKKGVGPGEQVALIFELDTGMTFADVIAELADETLRIGIHVTDFASEGSEAFVTGTPTAITLASFGAKASRGLVTLNWATGTEISNAGFHLYRSTSADGARARLTGAMIAAQGDAVSGGSYSFVDAAGYGTYFYWLEDVSYSGKTTSHGPVQVTVAPPYRSPLYRPALPGGR